MLEQGHRHGHLLGTFSVMRGKGGEIGYQLGDKRSQVIPISEALGHHTGGICVTPENLRCIGFSKDCSLAVGGGGTVNLQGQGS